MFNRAIGTFKIVIVRLDKLVPLNDYHPAEVFVNSILEEMVNLQTVN